MSFSVIEKKQKWDARQVDEKNLSSYSYAEAKEHFEYALYLDYPEKAFLFIPHLISALGEKEIGVMIAQQGSLACLEEIQNHRLIDFKPFYPEMLTYACHKGQVPIIDYLIKQGTDIHANDDAGLRDAFIQKRTEAIKYLVKTQDFPQHLIFKLCLYGLRTNDIYHVDMIIGTRIKSAESKNRLLRYIACDPSPHVGQIEYLIDHGARVGHNQQEPLRLATSNQNLRNIEALLKCGADPMFLPEKSWKQMKHLPKPVWYLFQQGIKDIYKKYEERVLRNVDDFPAFLISKDPITGLSGLMIAVRGGCVEEVVKILTMKHKDQMNDILSAKALLNKEQGISVLEMLCRTNQLPLILKSEALWQDDRFDDLLSLLEKLPPKIKNEMLSGHLKPQFQKHASRQNLRRLRERSKNRPRGGRGLLR